MSLRRFRAKREQRALRREWDALPLTQMPPPWRAVPPLPVGGAWGVGFDEEERYVLVVSFNGRGVFDVRDGSRVARDDDLDDDVWFDETSGTVEGIGPMAGRRIPLFGDIFGLRERRGLVDATADDWRLRKTTVGATDVVWCERPGGGDDPDASDRLKLWDWDCPMAWGFTDSGRTAVIACSNVVQLWRR